MEGTLNIQQNLGNSEVYFRLAIVHHKHAGHPNYCRANVAVIEQLVGFGQLSDIINTSILFCR